MWTYDDGRLTMIINYTSINQQFGGYCSMGKSFLKLCTLSRELPSCVKYKEATCKECRKRKSIVIITAFKNFSLNCSTPKYTTLQYIL